MMHRGNRRLIRPAAPQTAAHTLTAEPRERHRSTDRNAPDPA